MSVFVAASAAQKATIIEFVRYQWHGQQKIIIMFSLLAKQTLTAICMLFASSASAAILLCFAASMARRVASIEFKTSDEAKHPLFRGPKFYVGKYCSRCLQINCMIKPAATAASPMMEMQGSPRPHVSRAEPSFVGSPAFWS